MTSTDPARRESVSCAISYAAPVSGEFVHAFLDDLGPCARDVQVEDRGVEVFAGHEWLMPTVIVLFVTRKYFETLLEEAARDHYTLFKAAVGRLIARAQKLGIRRMGSSGKVSRDPPGAVSLLYVLESGSQIRFVFPQSLSEEGEAAAVAGLLDVLAADRVLLHEIQTIQDQLASGGSAGRVIARYDEARCRWVLTHALTSATHDLPHVPNACKNPEKLRGE
jgi:hypothetical protein